MKRILPVVFISLSILRCLGGSSAVDAERGFPYPELPDTLVTAASRANYLVTHFWDGFDFSKNQDDSVRLMLEQGFADFISVFPVADSIARNEAMKELVKRSRVTEVSANAVDEVAESYLFASESPVYDEEYFIIYLRALLDAGGLDEMQRIRPLFMLEEASKNRVGRKAADFEVVTRDGCESSLSELCADSPLTLLIFVDPDCETCAETVAVLNDDATINGMIDNGSLKIMAVYGGDDRSSWDSAKGKYPSGWTVTNVKESGVADDLYVIGSYPAMYLLDNDAVVIAKNVTVDRLMRLLLQ